MTENGPRVNPSLQMYSMIRQKIFPKVKILKKCLKYKKKIESLI